MADIEIRKARTGKNSKKDTQVVKREKTGEFAKGHEPPPDGRPFLKKNSELRNLIEPHADELVETAVKLALAGSEPALKMCLDRILPTKKYDSVKIHLYSKVKNLKDVTEVSRTILEHMCEGLIAPEQAKIVSDVLEKHRDNLERDELYDRVRDIERVIEHNMPRPHIIIENETE